MREPVDWPTRDVLSHRRASTPERTALVDVPSGRAWDYRTLDSAVDGVAARLRSVRRGESTGRIGLLASTRVGFVTAVHATVRNGDAVVPLNVQLAAETLSDQVSRAHLDVLVCERETESAALSVADCPVTSLDRPVEGTVTGLRPTDPPDGDAVQPADWHRDETAVVLFTSGTTGGAKGVRLTLGNLIASATASAFRLGVRHDDRWLCCLPAYHMGGLAPVFRTALYGTGLLLQPSFEVAETAEAIDAHRASGVSLVPTQLHRLLESGWSPPDSLETVLVGGAPASAELVERALRAGVPIHPSYGLTETASQVATATPEQVADEPDTLGHPLLFTEVTVLSDGEPVEAGQTGELVVDGPTVTPGYLGGDQDAFGEYGLRTGDAGYRDADGKLWVLGRADDAIVTGGETVHPTEVADALEAHSEVAAAAVVGLADEEWGERVAALVVADGDLNAERARSHARDRLAPYKVPKTVGFADELPRTISGTVDREAVRDRLRQ